MSECDTSRLLTTEFITIHGRMVLFVNFLNLPRDLLTNLATGWLNWMDVARWDSANCNKEHREEWLNIVQNDCVSEYVCISNRWASSSLHRWFVVRLIRTRNLYVENDDASKEPATIRWLQNTASLLTTVSFRLFQLDQMLACVANLCDKVHVLHFDSCRIHSHYWNVICGRFQLQELGIFGNLKFAKIDVPSDVAFPLLEKLDINWHSFSPGNASVLIKRLPVLRSLRVRKKSFDTLLHPWPEAKDLFMNACPYLIHLDLEHVSHVFIPDIVINNDWFVEVMGSLRMGLRCLVLPSDNCFRASEFEAIVQYHAHSLRSLRMPRMLRQERSIAEFVNSLPHLHTLDVTLASLVLWTKTVINANIVHVYVELDRELHFDLKGHFPSLKSLSLSNCRGYNATLDIEQVLHKRPLIHTLHLDDNRVLKKMQTMFPRIDFTRYSTLDIFRVAY